jgi:hypothetical protein
MIDLKEKKKNKKILWFFFFNLEKRKKENYFLYPPTNMNDLINNFPLKKGKKMNKEEVIF